MAEGDKRACGDQRRCLYAAAAALALGIYGRLAGIACCQDAEPARDCATPSRRTHSLLLRTRSTGEARMGVKGDADASGDVKVRRPLSTPSFHFKSLLPSARLDAKLPLAIAATDP